MTVGVFEHEALLAWYRANRREMPWRGHPSAYAVWVSEIMLQQTQVDTVRPYFERFIATCPTVESLAAAERDVVLKLWEGLGYYARARNLHDAAKWVVSEHSGEMPRTADGLSALKGVGAYTAAAIASICFGERIPVVDGNVARVFARVWLLNDDFKKLPPRQELARVLQPAFDVTDSSGDLNQAMMELGALICKPKNPECEVCPLRGTCQAKAAGRQMEFPTRVVKAASPVRDAIGVMVRKGQKWLMVRRDEAGLLGGLWELPGGELAKGESVAEGTVRLIYERTGLKVEFDCETHEVKHVFSHFVLRLHVVEARIVGGRIRPNVKHDMVWVSEKTVGNFAVATAHRRALHLIDNC